MPKLPKINNVELIAKTRLFHIEQVDLTFSNGAERIFERLSAFRRAAVMIVPMIDHKTFLLVREYSAGVEKYTLGFPKGLCEEGESDKEAANRELMEEAGYGARTFKLLLSLSLAPAFMNHQMHVYLGQDLYPQKLIGDEPEDIEVVPWSLDEIPALMAHEEFSEARSVAALLYARDVLLKEQSE